MKTYKSKLISPPGGGVKTYKSKLISPPGGRVKTAIVRKYSTRRKDKNSYSQ